MKINYVIGSYEGINKRKHLYPKAKDILTEHIEKIKSLKNNLTQITIVKPECQGEKIEGYYDNIDKDIVFLECENYGISLGQWLKAYYEYRDNFDYYIFIEDDYCPNIDNFDEILLKKYKQKFTNNIGLLCSLVQGSYNYKNSYPTHFEGAIFISEESLGKMDNYHLWKGNSRKYLDEIVNLKDKNFNWRRYINRDLGYYQLAFSHLFNLSDIKHEDYLDKDYYFPYWGDNDNEKKGEITIYDKGENVIKNYNKDIMNKSLIIPIQLSKKEYIDYYL